MPWYIKNNMQQTLEKKYRRSSQRQHILDYLQNSLEHPCAMRIFNDLKPSIPTLSLGNLYRNLGILLEQGLIIKVREPDSDEDRFDGHVDQHFHFYCQSCAKLFDIPAEDYPDLRRAVNAGGVWRVDWTEVNMRGLCPDCAKRLPD